MIAIQIPAVQTKAAQFAIKELNKTFGTQIHIDKISIEFFGDINLYGVSVKDKYGLDFIEIQKIQTKISLTGLIRNPNHLTLGQLQMYEPKIKVITYKNDSTSNFIEFIDSFSSDTPSTEESLFRLNGDLIAKNGKLLLQNQNLEPNEQNWVEAKNLNLKIENFRLINDDIWADLKHLSFDGKRNGEDYKLVNLSLKFHLSDKEMRFDGLNFKTQDSDFSGNLTFSFDPVQGMSNFEDSVQWDLNFNENSKIGFKDIRYFVFDFNKDSQFEVQGSINGSLNDLNLNDLQITNEGLFLAVHSMNLKNMVSDAEFSFHSESLKAKTSYQNLNNLLPSFIAQSIPDFIDRFGVMDYKGDLSLSSDQIIAKGSTVTALGSADLDVQLNDYSNNLKYKGSLTTSNMDLRKISEQESLGFIAGTFHFNGQGTDIEHLKIDTNGQLRYLDLFGKRYSNIRLDGNLSNQQFTGFASIRDANLNLNYNGKLDFSKKEIFMDFESKIDYLDLDYLGVTDSLNAVVSGNIDGKFSFSTIDDFDGNLNLSEIYFVSNTRSLIIENADISSFETDNNKKLKLQIPGYLDGEINGQYRLSQLPDAIMNALGSYTLISYTPEKVDTEQRFSFYFEFGEDLLSLLDTGIQIAPGTVVDGFVNTTSNFLTAELSSQSIGYDGIQMFAPLLNIDTSKEKEQIYVRSDSLAIKNVMLYKVGAHTTPIQDSLIVKTSFQMGREFPMSFDLNLFQTLDEEKNLILGFSPSTIQIDENTWQLNPDNHPNTNRAVVNFDKNYYELQQLLLESGEQKLLLDGYYLNEQNYKLNADLEHLILTQIIPQYLLGEMEINGIANGKLDITRTEDKLEPLMNLKVLDFSLNGYELGDLNLNGFYNIAQSVFDLELFIEQQQVQVLYASGFIDNKPDKPEINASVSLDDFNFNFIESFLSAAMSNVRGMISGNMRFSGPFDSPDFEGNLDLNNLGFKVDYLNVDYSFDGVNTVPVSKQSGGQGFISLEEIQFRDTKYGSKGEVSGQVLFRDFATWFLNLSFNTGNLLVLNTNMSHNDLFYGKVFAQGAFGLFGPPERLDISATATVNEGSEFTINTGATKIETENRLVRFIPEKEKKEENLDGNGMNIDLTISASPQTTVNLIFDPISGDRVIANGATNGLKFRMTRTGSMTLDGEYNLQSGKYKFRQVPLLNRDFEIKSGSYVRWNGGAPFDADMHITANFDKTVTNVGDYLNTGYSQAYDVVLGILISESLANPQMEFTLNIPKGGTDVQSLLDYKFNLDPDEKMIQFGAILLLGQFMTETEQVLAGSAASSGAGLALKQLGGIISSIITGGSVSVDVDYVSSSEVSNMSDLFKTDVKFNLSPRWTFNGAVGVPVGNGINDATTGEAEIQWDISKQMDKTMVVNFFTRPTNFGVQNFGGAGNFQSFGGGITYKTSFNRFSEAFRPERKKRKRSDSTEEKKQETSEESTKRETNQNKEPLVRLK